MLKIATWNVNSLRVRLPHVLQWLAAEQPDVLALQETKIRDEDFPFAEINQAGYQVAFSGQKTYNGMAVLSRKNGDSVITDLHGLEDPQRRVLGITIGETRVINLYVPNGESIISEKYIYKLNWLEKLQHFLKQEITTHQNLIILGDFNIAPHDIDVYDPTVWAGKVLCTQPEREAFQNILKIGFQDCYRTKNPEEKNFSWWDYRMNSFQRNLGVRIDHVLASESLAKKCLRCVIDKTPRAWERPSDHTPVVAEFEVS